MPGAFQELLDGDTEQWSPGNDIYALASELFPITRSITGNGVRQSLAVLRQHIPLLVHEIQSGTAVFDWTVPKEWNLQHAYISNSKGHRIVDAAVNNLHVVSYSTPVNARMTLADLKPHLHSLPNQPDLIPYRTSYYAETWGFCLPHKLLASLSEDTYHVVIDATLAPGSLTYGELYKAGDSNEEVLLSAHNCHPSLANDNCSGVALLTILAKRIAQRRTRYSYRFLFAPGTIGAIAWLAHNQRHTTRIRHGLIVSNVGDNAGPIYKRSRRGKAEIDRVSEFVLRSDPTPTTEVRDFTPYGYDERQYCSPGFNLPVGSFQRGAWGEFPEYHTSADNLEFISPKALEQSARMIAGILDTLEQNTVYINQNPYCEPRLGRHGLYDSLGTENDQQQYRMALLWILNLSDGDHDLLSIAQRSYIPFPTIVKAATQLEAAKFITRKP